MKWDMPESRWWDLAAEVVGEYSRPMPQAHLDTATLAPSIVVVRRRRDGRRI